MNENDILIAHASELKEKAAEMSFVTHTNFLSANELSLIIKNEKYSNKYVDTFYFGGYEDAERKSAIFVPSFYDIDHNELTDFLKENNCNPIAVLNVQKDRFSELSHRDYLGALMGLGIKREMIGDIVINENGCTIFCLKSISEFICHNLKQAGRGQLNVSEISSDTFKNYDCRTQTVFISVASMRLDCLLAAAFNLSRNSAAGFITQGLVFVNDVQILKSDFTLNEGDKLVLRGKGKTVIDEVIGESKKGRLHINIRKYI